MALSAEDEHALVSAAQARLFERDDVLLAEGGRSDALYMLCGGAARASRTLEDGNLQIVSVFLPGDMLNPGDVLLDRSPTTISALTSSLVLSIPVEELRSLLTQRPSIIRALWRETALQASIQRERLIGLGRKAAEPRLAHVLCELAYRLQKHAGDGDAVELPLTQVELADVLGISSVHVNRVLRDLRGRGLIDFRRGRLVIWKKGDLYKFAEFNPQYLRTEPADDG
jgi:CRP-like cAMP-binding protein